MASQTASAASALAAFKFTEMLQGPNCSVQLQNSLELLPDCDHSHFCFHDKGHLCAGQEENLSKGRLGSQMEHERPRSLTHGFFVCCCELVTTLPNCLLMASFTVMAFKPSASRQLAAMSFPY